MKTALNIDENGPQMVLTSQDVSKLLRYKTADSFLNIRKSLEDNGFPKKLPGLNAWSAAAIHTWIVSNGETITPPALIAIVHDDAQTDDERP